MSYESIIESIDPEACRQFSASEIEEIIRHTHPTMDHLTREEMGREIHLAVIALRRLTHNDLST